MEIPFNSSVLVLAVLPFLLLLLIRGRRNTKAINLPPGPWKLPFIGNLHQLIGCQSQHRVLRDLSRKYGCDLLHLRLGQIDHVVVSSPEATKEVLQTHDLKFASRPPLMAPNIVFYGRSGVAFSSYGSYWRQLRKISVVELLSARRVKMLSATRERETVNTIKSISSQQASGAALVNITKLIQALSCSIISIASFGSKCVKADNFISVVDEATALLNGLNVSSDLFPSFKFLDVLSGTSKSSKKVHSKIDEVFDEIIEEHQARRKQRTNDDQDFLDVLLGVQEKGDLELPLTNDNIKGVILDLFLAGTDTTTAVTVWAMTELMRHPEIMQKAQSEVRRALKGKSEIKGSDVEELHYIKLVIKETLRLHTPGPLILPRLCSESCRIMGYNILEGTRVLINVWAIARDPRYWEDGESFKPERFKGCQVDFWGGSFEFLPFGGGRRICPGITYSLASLEMFLASLLYHFDWELPDGLKPSDVDVTESSGTIASRKLDLCLLAKCFVA